MASGRCVARTVTKEFEGLTLDGGCLTQNSLRNDSGSDDMTVTGQAIAGGRFTDKFDFGGFAKMGR